MWRPEDNFGVDSLLLPCGSQGQNPPIRPGSVPTESPHWSFASILRTGDIVQLVECLLNVSEVLG